MNPTAGIHTSGQLAYWHKHWEGRPEYAGWQPLYTADQLREVEQQRDELLAALEQIGSMAVFLQFIAIGDKLTGDTKNEFEKHKVLGSFRKVKEIADAAIAKVKP